jgi:hypothetical protein
MRRRIRSVSKALWLGLAVVSGCAEAAIVDEIEELDSTVVVVDASLEAGSSLDADVFPWPDASALFDSSLPALDAASGADAGRADGGSGSDASVRDAGADAGPRDAGVDASADAGKADAGTADAGSADAGKADAGMCDPDNCTNTCTSAAQGPFRCCQKDGQCGCSWISGITSCD